MRFLDARDSTFSDLVLLLCCRSPYPSASEAAAPLLRELCFFVHDHCHLLVCVVVTVIELFSILDTAPMTCSSLPSGQSHLEFHSQWSHPSCAIGMERPWISGTTKTFGTIEITRLVHPDGVSWMFCVVGTFFNAPFTHMHVLDDDHHSVIHSHFCGSY